MNSTITKRPVGLEEICKDIEKVCLQAEKYKRLRIIPESYIVYLDENSDRTTIMEYASSMFREYGAVDFSRVLDEFLEIIPDGSPNQFSRCKYDISTAAVYDNYYTGLIRVDITAMACHTSEKQYEDFINFFADVSKHACVFFFAGSNPTKQEQKLVNRLTDKIKRIKQVFPEKYCAEDLAEIFLRTLNERNVTVKNADKVSDILKDILINKFNSTEDVANFAVSVVMSANNISNDFCVDENDIINFVSENMGLLC